MENMYRAYTLGSLTLDNRFVFPPIKLAYGNPDGTVSDRQLLFYERVARNGPGLIILEPVAVTAEGKEHPKQLCVHLPGSENQLKKIVDVIHEQGRAVCVHLNHAGAAANPMATKTKPRAPSPITCPASEQEAQALNEDEIQAILQGYKSAAEKALTAGFDCIEIQAGHGYLLSQFLNPKINVRDDRYGKNRELFPSEVISLVTGVAGPTPVILRISGNEMSPDFGLDRELLVPILKAAEKAGICAVHVGMGNACFSPPWYFHHASLPEKPQFEALGWVREHTSLPLIAAGRMGRKEKIREILNQGLADLFALGRPLIADPDLLEKWRTGESSKPLLACGYCLQGCLHRVKSGEGLGCNINPEVGQPSLGKTANPLKVLVAGGGPAGMSAAMYLNRRGHKVTLVEKEDLLGGQFRLAWQAPGKEKMKDSLDSLVQAVKAENVSLIMGESVDEALVKRIRPDLLVWAIGARQNIPQIPGLENQYTLTSIELFSETKEIRGPRVLVIGAGRVGLEIAEKLGGLGYEVVATKRTDPIGSMMEMVTKKLTLKRIGNMEKVALMPHTTVKAFLKDRVEIEQDGVAMSLEPFNSVILASGMLPAVGPGEEIPDLVDRVETIGDAAQVMDIFSAVRSGYELARRY
ncbi:MAG: FAD-dependent oxidoreductase [Deltaproteobacteria bacterium]|nr:FAD-dependent oxidoreductase [Deltaproteobacteria bacterium]MBW1948940.1 FAD-dependent oxidoreductase [Deltaproteobacteria bacterium]MBW2007142.1 FAD-dependent oxidoreductase [Deltaproteobacteria bacterium]MBW2103902.1 FAD-dependent oxidoreductase [Deltaproteobacteria bacterium]MBW2348124.1 FAD-dependent oxidoreductase [Deltaproteobacteria bacterium]